VLFHTKPPAPPLQLKKNNDSLCSVENSLQLDEETTSLAIIVAEKLRFEKKEGFWVYHNKNKANISLLTVKYLSAIRHL